jgi:hypothetical protein
MRYIPIVNDFRFSWWFTVDVDSAAGFLYHVDMDSKLIVHRYKQPPSSVLKKASSLNLIYV